MNIISKLLAAIVGLALTLPLAAQGLGTRDSRDPRQEAERAEHRDRERQRQARLELLQAQRELRRSAERVATLARETAGDEVERALQLSTFGRPVIGVVLREDPQAGVQLAAVTPDGPADRAGLKSGDRVLAIDGQPIGRGDPGERLSRARELVGRPAEGQTLALEIERNAQRLGISVVAERTPGFERLIAPDADELMRRLQPLLSPEFRFSIGELTPFAACPPQDADCDPSALLDVLRWRGLRMARLDADLGRYFGTERGVLLLAVDPDALKPLRAGDVLLEVDGQAVTDPGEVMRALHDKPVGKTIALLVRRDGRNQPMQIAAPRLSRLPSTPLPPAPPAAPAPPTPPIPASHAAPPPPPAPANTAPPTPAPAPPLPPARTGILQSVL
jgi:hypothetical protein